MYHRHDGHHNDHSHFHPMMLPTQHQQHNKDGNSLTLPNPSSNPLSPLSPSLLGLNPLADPSMLLSHPSYAPLDYSLFPQPYLPAEYQQPGGHPHPSAHLGLAVNATSDDLIGRVYTFAKDQYGCRLLQRLLDDGRPGVLPVVYGEVYPHINELMTDPFGNYLCQKLLEHCDEQQRIGVLNKVASDMVAISLNLHGTRAVQKLVETVASVGEVDVLVGALKGSVVTLVKDLNGNHVIQRCLHHLSSNDNQFIYDAVCRHCVSVATHKHGCCVLQRCIDYATITQKRQLIHEICNNALELVQDAYGNYVVQYVLDLNEPASTSAIVTALCGHVSSLAVQKFSSNCVEKCLELASDKLRTRLIDELTQPDRLPRLLSDPFANYCIQKALSVSKKGQAERLVAVIRPHLNQLRNTAFGKRIMNKISKRFPELSEDELAGMFYRDPAMDSAGAPMVGPGMGGGVSGVAGGVSSIGGGVYDPAVYGERSVVGTGTSPPPLVSPTSRQLNASGPVGAVGGGVNVAELGISLLSLSSITLPSNPAVSSSSPPPSSSSSPPPAASFYQPFAESNGSASGVPSTAAKDGSSPVGGSPTTGQHSSLFSP